jgi:hypothetical protein
VGSLSVARTIRLRTLLRSGVLARFRAPANNTRVVGTLVANLPGAARNVTVGRATRTVRAGRASIRVRLNRTGRRRLAGRRRTSVRLSVTGTAPKATRATARRSFVVRR